MNPATDCPRCPRGCGPFGIPYRAAYWNHRARETDRIVCPCCGRGWVGTDAEVEQAERAQVAWDAQQDEEERQRALKAEGGP